MPKLMEQNQKSETGPHTQGHLIFTQSGEGQPFQEMVQELLEIYLQITGPPLQILRAAQNTLWT